MRKWLTNKRHPVGRIWWLTMLVLLGAVYYVIPDRLDAGATMVYQTLILPVVLVGFFSVLGAKRGFAWVLPLTAGAIYGLTTPVNTLLETACYTLLYLMLSFLGLTLGNILFGVKQGQPPVAEPPVVEPEPPSEE